jgi:hypothetical protein
MKLWSYKKGEWVNLDHVAKIVCSPGTFDEMAFLRNIRTGEAKPNPQYGQRKEAPKVTLYMPDGKFVVVDDIEAILELFFLMEPMILRPESPTPPPSREGDLQKPQLT